MDTAGYDSAAQAGDASAAEEGCLSTPALATITLHTALSNVQRIFAEEGSFRLAAVLQQTCTHIYADLGAYRRLICTVYGNDVMHVLTVVDEEMKRLEKRESTGQRQP